MRCERKLAFFGIATRKRCPSSASRKVTIFYGGVPTEKYLCEGCAERVADSVRERGGKVEVTHLTK